MTTTEYRTLRSFAHKLLDNHPDLTLEAGDLVAEAYLKHGDDGGKMRRFMVGYAKETRNHPRRWLGYVPTNKKYPIETSQTCKCCQRELPFEDFDKEDAGVMVFYRQTCRRCLREKEKQHYRDQVQSAISGKFNQVYDSHPERRVCRVCDENKPIEQFPKQYRGMRISFRRVCKKCFTKQTKACKQRLAERRRNQPPAKGDQ